MNAMKKKLGSYILLTILTAFTVKAQTKVKTFSGEVIFLPITKKTIVFFYNSPTCTACKNELGKFLKANIDTNKIDIQVIARLLYSPTNFWMFDSEIRSVCPKIKSVYFDYTLHNSIDSLNTNNDGYFGYYGIKHSPSLLLINKKKTLLLKYEEIFDGYLINEKVKKQILEFFKQ